MVIRRSDARANQARVLEAAREVFAEQGLAAEIKDIAHRAGVGVATIYRGFGSKNELLQATIEEAKAEVADLLDAAEASDDPVDGLRTLITGMLGFAESYGWLIQASLLGNELDHLKTTLEEREEGTQRVARLLQRGIDQGMFLQSLPIGVVMLLIEGAVVALTFRVRKQTPRPSVAAIADGIVEMLTGSLLTPQSTARKRNDGGDGQLVL